MAKPRAPDGDEQNINREEDKDKALPPSERDTGGIGVLKGEIGEIS